MENPQIFFSEQELIQQLKLRERKAFNYLYDHYSPALYGVILQVVKTEEVAQDILQEVFIKIWGNIEQYSPTKSRLFTWMITIARNSAIDKLRSKEFKIQYQSLEINVKSYKKEDNTTQRQAEMIGLSKVLDGLGQDHRKIIDMMYFEGFSQTEIAQKLEIPLGTVKTRARMALQALREWLGKQ